MTPGLNYLVTIDSEGRLRWARNGQLVDTTAGRWKDAGEGKGIVPFDDPTPGITAVPRHSFAAAPSSSSSSSSSSLSGQEEDAMMHYVGLQKQSRNPVKRVLQKNFTLRGLLDRLLRKTIKRNTWIYVSVSTCLRLRHREQVLTYCRTKIVRAGAKCQCYLAHFHRVPLHSQHFHRHQRCLGCTRLLGRDNSQCLCQHLGRSNTHHSSVVVW